MPEDQSQKIKMFGYLEKRGKMTIRGRWKRRWCVLERHLLIYYKSQTEYLKLSPCCGSLNVALVRKIQPNVGCLIHITTHSQIIILRTPDKEKQEEWFHALASVLTHNNHEGLLYNDSLFPTVSSNSKSEKRGNRRSIRISETDEHIYSHNTKFATEKNNNSTELTCTNTVTEKMGSQHILKNSLNCKIINRCSSDGDIQGLPMKSNFKDFKRSFSCGYIFTPLSRYQGIAVKSIYDDLEDQRGKRKGKVKWNDAGNEKVSFVEYSEYSSKRNSKKRNKTKVVHRHSFGFLKRILTRRKSRRLRKEAQKQQFKAFQDLKNCCFTSIVAVTTSLDVGNSPEEITHSPDLSHEESSNINTVSEEIVVSSSKTNESLKVEKSQSWTMIECDRDSPNDELPELPAKTKKKSQHNSWQKEELTNIKSELVDSHTIINPNAELDELMSQLTNLNKEPDFLHNSMPAPDDTIPDYDIPRSHLSIISEIISEKTDTDNSSIGSPDCRFDNLSSFDMDPDSLEMPWLSNDGLNNNKYWPATSGEHFFLRDNIESDNDDSFLDSLNTIMHLP